MSLPKVTSAYPASMFHALDRAISLGELIIPCENPAAMRMQFQGLRGALRNENRPEKADLVGFYLQKSPPALIIRRKDLSSISQDISKALSGPIIPSATEEAEAAFSRILGGIQ